MEDDGGNSCCTRIEDEEFTGINGGVAFSPPPTTVRPLVATLPIMGDLVKRPRSDTSEAMVSGREKPAGGKFR